MNILLWSFGALVTGFILDILFGDPEHFPHIVRWMGTLISALEKWLRRRLPATEKGEKAGGILLVITVVLLCTTLPLALLFFCYGLFPLAGYAVESFLCWQCLAAKSLKTESMKVYYSLVGNDLEGARKHVSMIVGRDTGALERDGILRAAVETVAENASDGVSAPLLWIMLGGAPLGCLYKAVNTMDSMIGYKNDRYLHFGRAAAKLDDVFNYIPARVCALLMIAAAFFLKFDGRAGFCIWRRDGRKHPSPNSAQTEAACAGALGVRLAGPISYFGKMRDKPYIGDAVRPICAEDIRKANWLLYATSFLTFLIVVLFRLFFLGVIAFGAL